MKKRRNFFKVCSSFMVTLLLASSFSYQSVFAATVTQSVSGVNVSVSTDKDSYEIGEAVKLEVNLENTNNYNVGLNDVNVNLPEGLSSEPIVLPSTLEANANVTIEKEATVDASFENWTSVNLNGQDLKVGIKAVQGIVEPGSQLEATIVQESDPNYATYLEQTDAKDRIRHIAFLNLALRKPDGSLYDQLDGSVTVYLQAPEGWGYEELEVFFVSAGVDEQFEENYKTIDGIKYVTFNTNHFSPYALMDPLTQEDKQKAESKVESVKTGDITGSLILLLSMILVISFLLAFKFKNKARKILTIALCFGILTQIIYINSNIASAAEIKQEITANLNIVLGGNPSEINVSFEVSYDAPTIETIEVDGDRVSVTCSEILNGWEGRLILADASDIVIAEQSVSSPTTVYTFSELNLDDDTTYNVTLYDSYGNIASSDSFTTDMYGY